MSAASTRDPRDVDHASTKDVTVHWCPAAADSRIMTNTSPSRSTYHGSDHLIAPGEPDQATAAMIDAEVNEGGPASPIPCDTPGRRSVRQKEQMPMPQESLVTEACPSPDRVIHLPLGDAVGAADSITLMRSAGFELIRLVIPEGKMIAPHRVAGEITVQCLEGHVTLEHDGHALDLHAGDLLHLCPQESHALRGIAHSSVLVTSLRPHATDLPEVFPSS